LYVKTGFFLYVCVLPLQHPEDVIPQRKGNQFIYYL